VTDYRKFHFRLAGDIRYTIHKYKQVYYVIKVKEDTLAKSRTIMLVDDEVDVLITIKKMLERIGYEVHSFVNPLVAIEHMKDGCQDCVLLVSDIRMPSMSGFQFAKCAKELRPDLKIMFISAFEIHKQEWTKVLPSTQVDGFILKPIQIAQLSQGIQQCYPKTR